MLFFLFSILSQTHRINKTIIISLLFILVGPELIILFSSNLSRCVSSFPLFYKLVGPELPVLFFLTYLFTHVILFNNFNFISAPETSSLLVWHSDIFSFISWILLLFPPLCSATWSCSSVARSDFYRFLRLSQRYEN